MNLSKTLTLYKGIGEETMPFLEDGYTITSFRHNASRMGKAPTISATLSYPECLDDAWSDDVYVEFRGEKYFLKQTPSSSYDNKTVLYNHKLEFVSERVVLDTVYFFNVVRLHTTDDKPMSSESTFSFSGSIEHLAQMLNASMVWSSLDYSVVVDDGIVIEDKFVQFQDQFLSDALQTIFETFNVPYYFNGKTIHFGDAHNVIADTILKYGDDNAFISISKENTGNAIINRITGKGSDRNITYYYPNPAPKGFIALSGDSSNKYHVSDIIKFNDNVDLDRAFSLHYPLGEIKGSGQLYPIYTKTEAKTITIDKPTNAVCLKFESTFKARYAGSSRTEFVPIDIYFRVGVDTSPVISKYFNTSIILKDTNSGTEWVVSMDNNASNTLRTAEQIQYTNREFKLTIELSQLVNLDPDTTITFRIRPSSHAWVSDSDLSNFIYEATTFGNETTLEVTDYDKGFSYIRQDAQIMNKPCVSDIVSMRVIGEGIDRDALYFSSTGLCNLGDLPTGIYTVITERKFAHNIVPIDSVLINSTWVSKPTWLYDDSDKAIDFDDTGIDINDGYTVERGDSLVQSLIKRVNVQNNLMPSIYRTTDGKERFYNAISNQYEDEDGQLIVFKNEYSAVRPREHIYSDDEIYPTIKGVTNAEGLPIGVIADVAFDDNDNDDIHPVGHEKEGKYVHPYFFVKLRKFDGENGFNLFDHAIEGQPMTISMSSGKCMACNFNIGVDEATGSYNPVQVAPDGTLMKDAEGNVLCGRWPQGEQPKQDIQNDTQNNEVWIALKKEEQTFGEIMPNRAGNMLPQSGDEFVILGINLPDAYVTAAEKRLEDAIIEHMAENNEYKFNFSAKFSRIFFENNIDTISADITENSKAYIEYDGKTYCYYVSSYSYNMDSKSALPEVSITLTEKLKAFKSAVKKTEERFSSVIKSSIKTISKDAETANINIENKLSKMSTDISKTDKKIASFDTTIEAVEKKATSAESKAQDVQFSIGELDDRIFNAETMATTAQTKAINAESAANSASAKVDGIGDTVTILNTKVSGLESDFEGVVTTATNAEVKAKEASDKVDSLLEGGDDITLKGIKEQLDSIDTEIDGIDVEIEGLSTQIAQLDAKVDAQGVKIINLDAGKADKDTVTALEGAIGDKAEQSEVDELSNDVANLAKDVQANKTNISTNSDAIRTLNTNLNNKVDKITGKGLSTEDFTAALKTKLEGLSNYDDTAVNAAIAGLQTQLDTLVGDDADDAINKFNEIVAFLEGIEESDDLNSIIASIEQQIAGKANAATVNAQINSITARVDAHETDIQDLDNNKVDKEDGKGLSTNDYTNAEKNKLAGIAEGAEVNVQSDWSVTDTNDDAFIKNKPTIPTKTSELTNNSDFATTTYVTSEIEALSGKVDERVAPIEDDVADALDKADEAISKANTADSKATTAINTADTAAAIANQKLGADGVTADIVKPMATGTALSDVSESGVLSSKIDYLRGNRLAFLDPSEYTIEKKIGTDGAWETLDSTTSGHRGLFAGLLWGTGISVGSEFSIGSQVRITIHLAEGRRQGYIDYVTVRVFENGRRFNAKLEYASNLTNPTWEEVTNIDINTSLFLPTCILQCYKYLSQGYGLRITLTAINDKTVGSAILGIGAYGSNAASASVVTAPYAMARLGHMYSWDYLQNVTFPANINAKKGDFSEGLSTTGAFKATGSITGNALTLNSGTKNALLQGDGSPVSKSALSFEPTQITQFNQFSQIAGSTWKVLEPQHGILRANRLAFLSDDEFKVEMSTDNGNTWVEQAKADAMRKVFCGNNSGEIGMVSNVNNQMRITLMPNGKRYCFIDYFYFFVSVPWKSSSACATMDMEYCTEADKDTWLLKRANIPLEGQSGPNMFTYRGLFAGSSSWGIRFTIKVDATYSTMTRVYGIEAHGNRAWNTGSPAMANWDHLYKTNPSQDAIFPAKVQGTDFVYADGSTVAEYVRGKIDEVNADIAKKLPLPSVTNIGGNILTWDSVNKRVSDTGKSFATSLQDFDWNEPDTIPNCDLVQQYVAQSIPTAVATATERMSTPSNQLEQHYSSIYSAYIIECAHNVVTEITPGNSVTGNFIFKLTDSGAGVKFDNVWKIRFSGSPSVSYKYQQVSNTDLIINWEGGIAPPYIEGGIFEVTLRQFGGLWLGEWKRFYS